MAHMPRMLTRMARMPRWLAGSHVVHTRFNSPFTCKDNFALLYHSTVVCVPYKFGQLCGSAMFDYTAMQSVKVL